jgi:hypothetical protein
MGGCPKNQGVPQLAISGSSPIALDRYYRNKAGESIEAIALKDKVSETTVKQSIRAVEVYRQRNSVDASNETLISTILASGPALRKTLLEALSAQSIEVSEQDGKKIVTKRPNHDVRLRAVSEVTKMAVAVQPKSNGPSTHVQVGVAIPGARSTGGIYVGMEERLSNIMAEQDQKPAAIQGEVLRQSALELPAGEIEEDEPAETHA